MAKGLGVTIPTSQMGRLRRASVKDLQVQSYNPRQSIWLKQDQSLLPSLGNFSRDQSFSRSLHDNQALSSNNAGAV